MQRYLLIVMHSFFLLLSGVTVFAAIGMQEKASQSLHTLALRKISPERILEKQQDFYLQLQQIDANRRKIFFTGGVVSGVVIFYVAKMLMNYFSQQSDAPSGKNNAVPVHLSEEEQKFALGAYYYLREQHTFWGRVKENVNRGISFALCSIIVGTLLNASSVTFKNLSEQVKLFFHQTPQTLLKQVQQNLFKQVYLFMQSFEALKEDVVHFSTEQKTIPEKQHDIFYTDFMFSYVSLVEATEDFIALVLVSKMAKGSFSPEQEAVIENGLSYLSGMIMELGVVTENMLHPSFSFDATFSSNFTAVTKKLTATVLRIAQSLGTLLYGKEFSES